MGSLCLEVRGEYACFTRPELKVERVSYDVMTPSAARAVFEAVLWKPAIRWEVERIEVLRPIQWSSIRRNEVGSKVPTGSVETVGRGGGMLREFYADDDRQQRASMVLRDVAYRLWADMALTGAAGSNDGLVKYREMFRRRAEHGQCVNQPYLGCREFACTFELVEDSGSRPAAIQESRDLGVMLYDLDFADMEKPHPLFFRAKLERGVLRVPKRDSAEVLS
jgi:CRISPR-associated protein Cas5d